MTKVKEMWEALTAYQQQADAAGHGKSWARMCKEKTAYYAAYYAADAAAYAADAADYAADAAMLLLMLLMLLMPLLMLLMLLMPLTMRLLRSGRKEQSNA
jgi:hypothetical protein